MGRAAQARAVSKGWAGLGQAWGCPSPTLNICRAGLELAKVLGGPSLSRPLPYPQGSGPGQGKAQGFKTRKLFFFNIVTKI